MSDACLTARFIPCDPNPARGKNKYEVFGPLFETVMGSYLPAFHQLPSISSGQVMEITSAWLIEADASTRVNASTQLSMGIMFL